jgi:tRNA pseudouridine32 synthase/23S rRNA pseudouridine746 synthase
MKTMRTKVLNYFKEKTELGEVLKKMSALSSDILLDAAHKGAVWLQRGNGKTLRERSLSASVNPQDTVSFFYDPKVLRIPAVKEAICLFENQHYGIWIKEAGIVPQGSQAGDHASLLRFIEVQKSQEVFLVHRLDRETAGVMIFAYNSKAAGLLSNLFQKNKISKEYQAVVLGRLEPGLKETIKASLDDKIAITHFEVLESNEERSLLRVFIETGRLHQIRRHLDHIHHPVMGDPKYGRGNKNKKGLQLLAKSLTFCDPWDSQEKTWIYPGDLGL